MSGFRVNLFDLIVKHFDAEKVRKIYNITLKYPPISVIYYIKCIDWEKSESVTPDNNVIRQLFTNAARDYGKTEYKLWLQYIEWETSIKEFGKANFLYWQAKKTLEKPEEFIQAHAKLTNNIIET